MIVARADNGVIGRAGKLPWHLPEDLRHFRRVTTGRAMIMGRRTFESLPGLLPGRRHIVLTRDSGWRAPGAERAATPAEAMALAGDEPVAVIGGAEVFALFAGLADAVELTEVHCAAQGDVSIPRFDPAQWREVSRERREGEGDTPAFSFVRLERRDRRQ